MRQPVMSGLMKCSVHQVFPFPSAGVRGGRSAGATAALPDTHCGRHVRDQRQQAGTFSGGLRDPAL